MGLPNRRGTALRVVIDPGHGGADPGAIGQAGVMEKDVTLSVAFYLEKYLKQRDIVVGLTREKDEQVSPHERARFAEGFRADAFVSLHCNSHVSDAQGFEVVYEKDRVHGPGSEDLARKIHSFLTKSFMGHRSRGIKDCDSEEYPRSIYVVRTPGCPAALVEMEFISHPKWESWLAGENTQENLAAAIGSAIYDFLSHK